MASERLDCAIVNGTVVSPFGSFLANVGIRGEKIVIVTTKALIAKKRINAEGMFILPGLIDPHGHMQHCWLDGGAFRKETKRMVLGGVTTFLDYSVSSHGPMQTIEHWKSHIASHSYVDMGIQPIINGAETLCELGSLFEHHGISSFKFFFSGRERELYPNVFALNDGALLRAFEIIAAMGPPARAVVHAENWEIGWFLEQDLKRQGRQDGAAWTDAHPPICEEECIARACLYAERTGCPLYVVHIAVGAGPEILAQAKRKGVRVMGETCPHYLLVNREDELITVAKYNPAVKFKRDQEALWRALCDGNLDCVGSDHIVTTGRENEFADKGSDIWKAQTGLPGSGTILFTLLHGVQRMGLTFERLVEVASYNPAQAFSLYPRKGHIGPGADADLIILNPRRTFTFRNQDFLLDLSLLNGMRIKGCPESVFLRGKMVVDQGRVVGEPTGVYLPRVPRQNLLDN